MAHLPITCPHCSAKLMHYGRCNCAGATLDWVDVERAAIKQRLERLNEIELEATKRKLVEIGYLDADGMKIEDPALACRE